MTTQAPHIIRTAVAIVAELPEHMIRIISPDIGGGFGNKVPVYPGYVCAIVGALKIGRPVKWIADRPEDIVATTHSRDIDVDLDVGYSRDGRLVAAQATLLADVGAYVHASGVITPEVAAAQIGPVNFRQRKFE